MLADREFKIITHKIIMTLKIFVLIINYKDIKLKIFLKYYYTKKRITKIFR